MAETANTGSYSKGKKIKFALFTLLFLLVLVFILGEVILSVTGYQSTYAKAKRFTLNQAKWWACDSASGPRYVANQVGVPDSIHFLREIWYYHRLKMINNDGYHDRDNFTPIAPSSDSLKVLVAGDSFTWGASADIDSSYVDVLESDIKKTHPALVWNTGIPATGTNHALFTVKKYLPMQHSNYVVLGFYVGNDFEDNLLPYDQLVFNDLASCYNLYDYDKDFKPYPISKREAFKKATGTYPIEELNFFQKLMARSKFISFLGDLKMKVANRLSGNKGKTSDEEYKLTKQYLQQLKDYVQANNAELIVLIIPASVDIKEKEEHYLNAVKLMKELSIPYVDPINLFTPDDYLKIDGGHWKNRGHVQAGHMLSQFLLNRIKEKGQSAFSQKCCAAF